MEEAGYDADTESDIESARMENLSGYGSLIRHSSCQNKINSDAIHFRNSIVEEIKIVFPEVITFVLCSINQIFPELLASNKQLRHVL